MNQISRRSILRAIILSATFSLTKAHSQSDKQVKSVIENISYSEHRRQAFDLYLTSQKNRPVVVFVHGGGWSMGNKRVGEKMGRFFVDNGFNFVSTNYRLFPEVGADDQAQDIAFAIKSLIEISEKFSIDSSNIGLIGHSAGAHLAALTALNQKYFNVARIDRKNLKAVVLLDGAGYDISKQMKDGITSGLYRQVFGEDEKQHRELSPITYADRALHPAFQIHHVERRADSKYQANYLAKKLQESGNIVQVHSAVGESHASIQRGFGDSEHVTTQKTMAFFQKYLK